MSVASGLRTVLGGIDRACERAGRTPGSVRLVAVTKTVTVERIREAYEAGQRVFGENYVQELTGKAEALSGLPDIEWHYIGSLQRNKVRHVLAHVRLLQTVDSVKLLEEIEKRAQKRIDVLVEVNVGREPQKAGCMPDGVGTLVDRIERSDRVRCLGLMVLPPFDLDPEEARSWFAALRELRDSLGGAARLPELSMGMSADYEVAVEEGATIVRVGTAIFGPR